VDLALKDLRQVLRDWKSALFLVIMPVLFTLFFGFVLSPQLSQDASGGTALPVGWMDRSDGSALASSLGHLLSISQSIDTVDLAVEALETLKDRVAEGELAGAIIVPEEFAHAQVDGEWPALTLIADETETSGQTVIQAVELALDRLRGARQMALISADAYNERGGFESPGDRNAYLRGGLEAGVAFWADPPIRVEVEAAAGDAAMGEGELTGFTQASPGMIVQFAIFGLITSAMVLVLERKSGALSRLMTTPLSKFELIAGHILAMFLIILGQEIVLVALGQIAFGVNYGQEVASIGLMIITLALWGASLGLLIGAVSKSEQGVVMLSLAAMFLFSGLGGAWFPLEVAGESFAAIGHLTPTAWAMDGFQNLVVRGLGFTSVLAPAGMLLAYTIVFLGLAVWRFRVD
jgi:ABC-2 type transport system permease protein